jgi:hypothetical protein
MHVLLSRYRKREAHSTTPPIIGCGMTVNMTQAYGATGRNEGRHGKLKQLTRSTLYSAAQHTPAWGKASAIIP